MSQTCPERSRRTTIGRLVISSPYEEPARHWREERESRLFSLEEGGRPVGYRAMQPGIGPRSNGPGHAGIADGPGPNPIRSS